MTVVMEDVVYWDTVLFCCKWESLGLEQEHPHQLGRPQWTMAFCPKRKKLPFTKETWIPGEKRWPGMQSCEFIWAFFLTCLYLKWPCMPQLVVGGETDRHSCTEGVVSAGNGLISLVLWPSERGEITRNRQNSSENWCSGHSKTSD